MVEPDATWSPEWDIDQQAATLWYHPHPHGETESHVARGLAGMFLVQDDAEAALPLPREYGVDDVPVVVLVNRGTASASEIVTGALQDRDRATVVGTRTFGKGVFQEIEQLSNGGALDITVGEYFLPSGRNIGGGGVAKGDGITPDVKALDDPKTKPDEALDKAVGVVLRDGT